MLPDIFMPSSMIGAVDILASIGFAATGALVASRQQLDILGFCWMAVITGVGGGTVRDLLLAQPVFWVVDPLPIYVCLATALVVHFVAPAIEYRYRFMLRFDAFGMALVTVVGTAKGLSVGAPALVAVVMGVLTASFGGIIRDTLGQQASVILKPELYVVCSAAGASLYVLLVSVASLPATWAGILAFTLSFLLRLLAIRYGWQMPLYRARPARENPNS